jgi:hypothetical protein
VQQQPTANQQLGAIPRYWLALHHQSTIEMQTDHQMIETNLAAHHIGRLRAVSE